MMCVHFFRFTGFNVYTQTGTTWHRSTRQEIPLIRVFTTCFRHRSSPWCMWCLRTMLFLIHSDCTNDCITRGKRLRRDWFITTNHVFTRRNTHKIPLFKVTLHVFVQFDHREFTVSSEKFPRSPFSFVSCTILPWIIFHRRLPLVVPSHILFIALSLQSW
jgi:hypothetical protein